MVSGTQILSRFRAELIAKMFTSLLQGLLVVILARLLTGNEYGLLFLAISFFSIAQLFSKLGIGASVSRYIAEFKETDPTQVPHLIRIGLFMTLTLVALVSIIVLIGNQYFARVMGEEELAPLLILGIGFLIFTTLMYYTRKVFQGFEAIATTAKISIIVAISKFVFTLALVLLGFGAIGALAGYTISVTVGSIIGLVVIYIRYYRRMDMSPVMESGLTKRIAEYAVPLSATNAAAVIDRDIDTLLVGFFLNPLSVSYYVVSKQIVMFIETPVNALGFSIAPTFAAETNAGNIEYASRIYEEAFINTLLLYIPAGIGILVIAEPLINLFFGSNYLGAVPVLQVLSVYVVLLSSNYIAGKALDFLGRARDRAIVKIITSVMNALLNVLLIPRFGVVGAAYATLCTYSLYAFANIYLIHQELHLQLWKIGRSCLKIIGVSIIMGIVVSSLLSYIQGWFSLFGIVFVGVSVWGVLALLIGLLNLQDIKRLLFS